MNILPPHLTAVSLIFVVNQLLERSGVFIPFVHSYLDDVLAIPIVLGFTLLFQQQITYRNSQYKFGLAHIIFMIVLLSVYFEWYLPSRYDHHYADVWDILAYVVGGFFYFRWMNMPSVGLIYMEGRFPFIFVEKRDGA